MSKILISVTIALLATSSMSWNPQESSLNQDDQGKQERVDDRQKFMRSKLKHSSNIVEGLSLENFPEIEKAAQDLMLMSNESNWKVVTTAEYIEASRNFRDACQELKSAAKKKNVEAATLAYFEVTLNCVRCHKKLRPVDHFPAKPIDKDKK